MFIFFYVVVDNCINYICYNGGLCVNNVSNYLCNCLVRYMGDYCEIGKVFVIILCYIIMI